MATNKTEPQAHTAIPTSPQNIIKNLNKHAHWYALRCTPRHERRIVERLAKCGIDSYVPVRRELHQWSDRKKWVDVVLTPRFIFVKIKLSEKSSVFVDRSILSIVHMPGTGATPCPIPDEQMRAFIELTQRTSNLEVIQTPLTKGDFVRVMSGTLEGYEGEFVHLDGQHKIIVRLNGALTVAVSMPKSMVEKVPRIRKK